MATGATRHSSRFELVATPFRTFGSFLTLLAETAPRMQAMEQLRRMSDEELAVRGTTRHAEIRRIFGVCLAI